MNNHSDLVEWVVLLCLIQAATCSRDTGRRWTVRHAAAAALPALRNARL
jgi:hypothetical protein